MSQVIHATFERQEVDIHSGDKNQIIDTIVKRLNDSIVGQLINRTEDIKLNEDIKHLSSIGLIVGCLALTLIVILSMVWFVSKLRAKNRAEFRQNVVKDVSDSDNQFEVVVHDSHEYSGSKASHIKSLSEDNHKKQTFGRKALDAFGTQKLKTSDNLESVPESSKEQQSFRMKELFQRMSPSVVQPGRQPQSNGSRSGSSMFSDTILKMDQIIDKSFDGIINSIEDNRHSYRYSSDEN